MNVGDFKNSEFITKVCSSLIALADDYFARGDILQHNGWSAFVPLLNMLETTTNKEIKDEYKYFEIEVAKKYIGHGAYYSEFWLKLRLKRKIYTVSLKKGTIIFFPATVNTLTD